MKKLLLSWQAPFPLPLSPEPERELVQVTDVKTRKHLQRGATSSLQYCLRQAGILARPLLLTRKMLSRDPDIHSKASLFSSCCEWPSTSTPHSVLFIYGPSPRLITLIINSSPPTPSSKTTKSQSFYYLLCAICFFSTCPLKQP